MKRVKIILSVIAVMAICLGLCLLPVWAADGDTGDWHNDKNGKATITVTGGDTFIDTAGNTAFGSSFVLNEKMGSSVTGEFDMDFKLNANLTHGDEVWISAVNVYNENSQLRTGLHFVGNDWLNIAIYGTLGGVDKGFAHVINKDENFPALTSEVAVKVAMRYSVTGDSIWSLYLNGVKISEYNLTENFGYNFIMTEAVGFDLFNAQENMVISEISVTDDISDIDFRKTNINNFVYYGKQADFSAKRLTTSVDTEGEVRAYTYSEAMTAGLFVNGISHNYEAYCTVKSITPKTGEYEFGFYSWYKDAKNYVLQKVNGSVFTLEVMVNGELSVNESVDYAVKAGDKFSLVKRTGSDLKTQLTAAIGDKEIVVGDVEGIEENYYIGLYGKNVKADFEKISTATFYVPFDFVDLENWKVSGNGQYAWTLGEKYPETILEGSYVGGKLAGMSVAVTDKVINDADATYSMTFDIDNSKNCAYGIVPYFINDGEYLLAGVEITGGQAKLFIRSTFGLDLSKDITSAAKMVEVERKGENFTVKCGEEVLTAEKTGKTQISAYYGFTVAGEGKATVTAESYDGFKSFDFYEENGWEKSSYEKDDIRFAENTIYIDGNHKESGVTEKADMKINKVLKAENYTNDYVVTVDLTKVAEPDGQNQRLGIVAWYLDESNYIIIFVDQWTTWEAYQVNACGVYNGERMLDSNFNDYEWFLGFKDTPGFIDKTFTLKVIKNGQRIQAFIGEDMIFNTNFEKKYDLTVYDDDTLKLGLFSAGIESKFENYSVRAMTSSEGTPTPPVGNRPTNPPDSSDSSSSVVPPKKKSCGYIGGLGIAASLTAAIATAFIIKRKK